MEESMIRKIPEAPKAEAANAKTRTDARRNMNKSLSKLDRRGVDGKPHPYVAAYNNV